MNSRQRLYARMVLIFIAIGAFVLISALFSYQVVNGKLYAEKANKQYFKPSATLLDRGTIYFTSKDGTKVSAAGMNSGYMVYINPSVITDVDGTFQALSAYLKIDQKDFMAKIKKSNEHYQEVADRVDPDTAKSLMKINLLGVSVIPEKWRIYPGDTLAAHTLGLIGEDASSSALTGRYGLERYYQNTLFRNGNGSTAGVFADIFSSLKDSVLGANTSDQGDIVTTIEPTVQSYLEKILNQTSTTWHPDEIGGIIIDPRNGEILSMASLPTYNPNDTSAVKNVMVFSDPLVSNAYEMGSIMKPLTMVTALDSKAVTPESTYNDIGCETIDQKKICNFDGKARGVIPMQQILSQSLNIGAETIARKVGKDVFGNYFSSFGFGSTTGIDLPSEASGIVKNLKVGKDIDLATASYGQGIAISPITMARALSVIPAGGYVVTPHLVKEIDYVDGRTKTLSYPPRGPVLNKKSTDEVTAMLVNVVDVSLKKGQIKNDRYTIAAKTGTAQIPDHVKGGYYPDRYLHSFFGYFPAYNPRFLVFLYQTYPKGAQYASETLTDPFDQLTTFLISYYNLAPDR